MQSRMPKYRRAPERLPKREITERSIEIIAALDRFKYLPTSILTLLISGHEKHISRHLHALYHKGLINRFAFPRVGNPGEFHYYLDSRHALELLIETGSVRETLDYENVRHNFAKNYAAINFGSNIDDMQGRLLFLFHEVMISRFHAMLELGSRTSGGTIELAQFTRGASLWDSVDVPKFAFERGKWRETDDTERIPHRPDAFFTLRFPTRTTGDNETHFFYEADRKHTSTPKHNRKLRGHFHYIVKQRKHEAKYGLKRIRAVLIETTDMFWADTLRSAAAGFDVSGNKPSNLFWFTTSELFTKPQEIIEGNQQRRKPEFLKNPSIIFRKYWASPTDDTLYSLLD